MLNMNFLHQGKARFHKGTMATPTEDVDNQFRSIIHKMSRHHTKSVIRLGATSCTVIYHGSTERRDEQKQVLSADIGQHIFKAISKLSGAKASGESADRNHSFGVMVAGELYKVNVDFQGEHDASVMSLDFKKLQGV